MSFKCRYCSEKFCSEHRLPENHDCEGLQGEPEEQEWFEEKFKDKKEKPSGSKSVQRAPVASYRTHRKSLSKDILKTLTGSATLLVIAVTTLSYILQINVPGYQELLILDTQLDQILLRPWSLLTVILLHGPPIHIIGNMLTFYFFATPLERLLGSKGMLKIYLIAALGASLAMVVFHNLLRVIYGDAALAGLAVGASGGVIALVGVVAKLYPNADVLLFFIIPMKIKTLVYAFGAFEAINLTIKLMGIQLPVLGVLASEAHLAGLLIGLYFGEKLQKRYKKSPGSFNPLEV